MTNLANPAHLSLGPARRPARATSYDVARLAGVSQSAVSRAYRNGASLSPALRTKVEAAAAALGYAPSQIARSLITRHSRLIGVLVTDLTARNYPDLLRFLSDGIQSMGNRMLLASVPDDGHAAPAAADLLAFHVDGLVSSASLPAATLERCARHGVPVVHYNREPRSALASAIACDHRTAMEALVAHLETGGLGRVAFVAGPAGAPVSDDRLRGAQAALAARARSLQRVVHADYSHEGGRALVHDLLDDAPLPDTIICANDAMALGVIDGLRFDLRVDVPGRVAVAGFDDVQQAAWPAYGLTTLRQPVRRLCAMALGLLGEHIAGETDGGERRLLPAELVVRTSTRPPGGRTPFAETEQAHGL